jgi:hypothetical protein
LISRQLPNGTVLEAPDVAGFYTYTAGYRHFHIKTPGTDGQPVSVSFAATYTLTDSEYSQSTQYSIGHNQPEGSGVTYDMTQPFTTPVTRDAQRIEFQDGPDEPILVFTSDGLVATQEGEFIDRWVRLE